MKEIEGLLFTSWATVNWFEDKEDIMEYFMELESEINEFKWKVAKVWMFGEDKKLTAEDNLAIAGLI